MMTLFTNVLPILAGFLMKLFAMNQQAKQDAQKMQLEALTAKSVEIDKAREQANKESPMASMNRRIIILTILGLIIFTQVAPPLLDINTTIPVVEKSNGFLGFGGGETTTFIEVAGLVKYDEVFKWASMIIEFYFGAQLAKRS